MYRFYEYCFYRIVSSKLYRKVAPHNTIEWSSVWVPACQCVNILSLLMLYGRLSQRSIPIGKLFLCIFIPLYIVNAIVLNESRYIFLQQKYQNEKNKKIKGCGVLAYMVLSWVLYAILCCRYTC